MAPSRYASSLASAEPLAQPLQFGFSPRTAKNRLKKSAMAENLATWSASEVSIRGVPTKELIELYRRWGENPNSFGVISTGNIDIEFDHLSTVGDLIITPECDFVGERFEAFKNLAAAAKAQGSIAIGEVTHPGRQVDIKINPNPISASDVQLEPQLGSTFGKPREATEQDIRRIIEGFAHAAEYLEKAGFDGIELHAAHGYLLAQFLSRTTNKRTDDYGVSTLKNRTRLISEIATAIRARVSPNFILAAKLNSVEFQDGGVTTEEAHEICAVFADLKFDYLEISGGTYEELGMKWTKDSTRKRESYFIEFAEKVVDGLGDRDSRRTKAYIVGGLRSVGAMVQALEIVDGVSIARPAAQEPRLASDIIEGRITGAIRPVPAIEDDFGQGMLVAGTHLRQIGKGQEPFDASNEEAVGGYVKDLQEWFKKATEDPEHHGYVDLTGEALPYGSVA